MGFGGCGLKEEMEDKWEMVVVEMENGEWVMGNVDVGARSRADSPMSSSMFMCLCL